MLRGEKKLRDDDIVCFQMSETLLDKAQKDIN